MTMKHTCGYCLGTGDGEARRCTCAGGRVSYDCRRCGNTGEIVERCAYCDGKGSVATWAAVRRGVAQRYEEEGRPRDVAAMRRRVAELYREVGV